MKTYKKTKTRQNVNIQFPVNSDKLTVKKKKNGTLQYRLYKSSLK